MSDGPLSIVALLWCVAFGVTFGIGVALAIEIVKTAWQVARGHQTTSKQSP